MTTMDGEISDYGDFIAGHTRISFNFVKFRTSRSDFAFHMILSLCRDLSRNPAI